MSQVAPARYRLGGLAPPPGGLHWSDGDRRLHPRRDLRAFQQPPACPLRFHSMADIKMVGIDVDGVGQPRNDGTPGSALYEVPIKLSVTPSELWAEIAVKTWDSPPSYTTMHRPGIASVVGDHFILDGTTVDEVESHHAKTLKLVVEKTNELVRDAEERDRLEEDRLKREAEAHTENVETVAKRIKFD